MTLAKLSLTNYELLSLRKKCSYTELFWFVFSRIRTKYGDMRSISPYSVRMRESMDQNNSEYGQFLRSVFVFLRPRVLPPTFLKCLFLRHKH